MGREEMVVMAGGLWREEGVRMEGELGREG